MSKKKSGNKVIEEDPSIVENFDPHAFIVLQSLDGHVFFVEKECAYFSEYIKERLRQQQHAIYNEEMPIPVVDLGVDAYILEKVIQYMHYKKRWDHDPDNRPEFHVDPEDAVMLLMAAHTLKT